MTDIPPRHLHLVAPPAPEPVLRAVDPLVDTVDALLTVDLDLPLALLQHVGELIEIHAATDDPSVDQLFELWLALSAAAGQSRWWRQRWKSVAAECDPGR